MASLPFFAFLEGGWSPAGSDFLMAGSSGHQLATFIVIVSGRWLVDRDR